MPITELAAAETPAPVKAGFLPSGAVGERGTGSGIDSIEAPSAFTCSTSGIGQTQLGTSTIVFGTAISSWSKIKRISKLSSTNPFILFYFKQLFNIVKHEQTS